MSAATVALSRARKGGDNLFTKLADSFVASLPDGERDSHRATMKAVLKKVKARTKAALKEVEAENGKEATSSAFALSGEDGPDEELQRWAEEGEAGPGATVEDQIAAAELVPSLPGAPPPLPLPSVLTGHVSSLLPY
jgi:hypothetical protein